MPRPMRQSVSRAVTKSSRNTSSPFQRISPTVPRFSAITTYRGFSTRDTFSLPSFARWTWRRTSLCAELGKAKAAGSNNRKQWTELRALDNAHSNPILYTRDGKQLYGVLQANPGGEESYPHLSDLGGAGAFAASAEFGRLANPNPLKLNLLDASDKLNQVAVQQIVQIKDISDMIVMDFIMSQADRFSGNIHSEKVYIWLEDGVLKKEPRKSSASKAAEQLKNIPPGAVLVNRMIMKDNDAGLISGNSAKTNHLLEKVNHADPKTYNRLLDLQKELQKPEVAEWYQQELLFTPANFKTVKDNVDQAVDILNARKEKGLFFLDASLSVALGTEGDKKQEIPETPGPGGSDTRSLPVITSSVGRWERGAKNLPADVVTVQSLLKAVADKLPASQVDPKGIDGKIAHPPRTSNTVSAIEAFQGLSSNPIDGLIEPGSETWKALLKASGEVSG